MNHRSVFLLVSVLFLQPLLAEAARPPAAEVPDVDILTLAQDPSTGVRLAVSAPTCKRNYIRWMRPRKAMVPCGRIARYEVYRNGLLISRYGGGDGLSCATNADTTVHRYNNEGREGDVIDEASEHTYQVWALDADGFRISSSPSIAQVNPSCPDGPLEISVNVTLVTFSDLVAPGTCATYPCYVEHPAGLPFTLERATQDFFATGPHAQLSVAQALQWHAPNKPVHLTGEVRGWIILGDREDHYQCLAPYTLSDDPNPPCPVDSYNRMRNDAMSLVQFQAPAHNTGLFFYGIDYGGGSGGGGNFTWFGQDPAVSGLPPPEGLPIVVALHEMGHSGFNPVSGPDLWHSYSLVCPAGQPPVGRSLRNLTLTNGDQGSCFVRERGDFTCGMANGGPFNGEVRWSQNFIDHRNVRFVPKGERATITLEQLEQPSKGVDAVKLVRVGLDQNQWDSAYSLTYRTLADETGVLLHLSVRHPLDLGVSIDNSTLQSVQTLMLRRGDAPFVISPAHPVYCDRFFDVGIHLVQLTSVGGVEVAVLDIGTFGQICN